MEKIVIESSHPLYGSIDISGAKNAAIPIIFASFLTESKCIIENLPAISDVKLSLEILESMGCKIKMLSETSVEIDSSYAVGGTAPGELVRKMRGSYYLVGAELARFGKASVSFPGGCDFGTRPIDQHIKGFEALGANTTIENGNIESVAENGLCGTHLYFDNVTVGGTINVMLAAVKAQGQTVIENAAREPHIVDVANFLNSCGANITGAGTDVIKIKGVSELHGTTYAIIPDMIEAGTYMCAAAAAGGTLKITNVIPKHLESITAKLEEMGVSVTTLDDSVIISRTGPLSPIRIKTLPYPGFPTDMNPQFSVLLCLASGVSTMTEGIYDNRFRYVDELRRMGANITVDGRCATFTGGTELSGAPVRAVDLRAGAAMIIAALATNGRTEIEDIKYIERGYQDIVGKLAAVGADIKHITVADEVKIDKAN
ncbi:MAG: UDP-N-acetylglucosamine 1-carboxyvinyltransferase [Ruminococcaceae bacterium]|nr:UDP-N-acetylglucosamine 1-carboxyvinyltransferase [Oscillospiraceae bacterium]